MILTLLKKKLESVAVSKVDALLYLYYKGFYQFIRGMKYFIFYSDIQYPFFLGRQSKVRYPRKLTAGKGCFIGDFCIIDCLSKQGVVLGDRVTIREFGWVQLTSNLSNPGESISIGSNTYIGPRVYLGAAAPISIGERCQIGGNVSFIAENHKIEKHDKEMFTSGVTRSGIVIGDDCWIGNGVVILDGVTIGDGVVIGAGSIVTKDFPDHAVIVGNPAKVMRVR